jgi:hypothetical protein
MLVNNAGRGMRTVNPPFMTHPQGFWEVPIEGFRVQPAGSRPRGTLRQFGAAALHGQ